MDNVRCDRRLCGSVAHANLASRAGRGLCAGDSCVAPREVEAFYKGKLNCCTSRAISAGYPNI
jgi:hypothetical protein